MRNFWLIWISRHTLSYLPEPIGYLLAWVVADVIFLFSRRTKGIVLSNLRRALGTEDEKALQKVGREVFRNLARSYFDLLRLPRFPLEKLERSLTIHGWHHFEAARAAGRGVILATAHLGNFDLVAQVMVTRGERLTVLVEPQETNPQFQLMNQLRGSRGLAFLPLSPEALRQVLRELRSGGVVVVACDRNVAGRGLKVNFLGEEATLPTGAVEMALRTGACLLPAFSIRQGRRSAVYVEPPVPLPGGGQDGVGQGMALLLSSVERYVRSYPEQWVLMAPIWPSRR